MMIYYFSSNMKKINASNNNYQMNIIQIQSYITFIMKNAIIFCSNSINQAIALDNCNQKSPRQNKKFFQRWKKEK